MKRMSALCGPVRLIAAMMIGLLMASIGAAQTLPPDYPPDSPNVPGTQPSTQPGAKSIDDIRLFARDIEIAHGKSAWRDVKAVQADMVVTFQGTEMINGTMLYEPSTGRARFDLVDGTTMVFDGKHAWIAPAESGKGGARFHLLTWPYFLAVPFKLRDPGTNLRSENLRPANGRLCETARLTFDKNTGDTPDDWYLLFSDPASGHLRAMAYIVTYGASTEKAEEDPHAIVYHDFKTIDGVTLSTKWTFHDFDEQKGISSERIGEASLHNVTFLEPEKHAFDKPENAREDNLPGSDSDDD